eukprot:gene24130-30440_t
MCLADASVLLDVTPTADGIYVSMPNGETIKSTHTATLDLPALPNAARTAHIFPGLTGSLLSISQMCDNGMTVIYDAHKVTVQNGDGTVALTGGRAPHSRLWMIDIENHHSQHSAAATALAPLAGTQTQTNAFYHAAMWSPAPSTMQKAIEKGFLSSMPGLTAKSFRKFPPNSVATAKGHLDQTRQRKNRSTRPSTERFDENDEDWHPPTKNKEFSSVSKSAVYWKLIPVTQNHLNHIDAAGRFPVISKHGNQYMLVMFCEDGNYIHVETMRDRSGAEYVKACQSSTKFFTQRGVRPQYIRLDNETSSALEEYCLTQTPPIRLQFVPPGTHRANRAERAIRTWKNHFIAGLATTDPSFPLIAWDELVAHGELTLNLMRSSGISPFISAWHQLHGAFSFEATPIAPPGARVVVHEKPSKRASWDAHGKDGYYLGPALEHYRSHRVFVTETHSCRISDTVAWFFKDGLTSPGATTQEDIALLLVQLTSAISTLATSPNMEAHQQASLQTAMPAIATALRSLGEIFAPPHTTTQLTTTITPPPGLGHQPPRDIAAAETAAEQRVLEPDTEGDRPASPIDRDHEESIENETRDTTTDDAVAAFYAGQQRVPASQAKMEDVNMTFGDYTHEHGTTHAPTQPAAVITRSRIGRPITAPERLAFSATLRPQDPVDNFAGSAVGTELVTSVGPKTVDQAMRDPTKREKCIAAVSKELTKLLEDYGGTMHFILPSQKPAKSRKASYFNPQLKEKVQDGVEVMRVRGTYGGDKAGKNGDDVTAHTAEMVTIKLFANAAISEDAEVMFVDISDYYLGTVLPEPEYMWITKSQIPHDIQQRYQLHKYWVGNRALVEITRGIYGLPQAGKLAQDKMKKLLAANGYHETPNTPCLFRHETRDIFFTLVVDDFAIKFQRGTDSGEHLLSVLAKEYKYTVDREARKYIGITFTWDRINRTVNLSMPNYVAKALNRFEVIKSNHTVDSPLIYTPPSYGKATQQLATVDESELLSSADTKTIQAIVGVFAYYSRAVDPTMLTAVNKIGSKQAMPTVAVQQDAQRLLQYAAHNPDASITYHASDMVLAIHSDASYLSETKSRSRAGGFHFLTNRKTNSNSVTLVNGAIECISTIIPSVVSSAGEAEYAGMFINATTGEGERNTLADLGYPQNATEITSDNSFAVGLTNGTVKQRKSKAIDMRYHWILDRIHQGHFKVGWKPGKTNLADYFTKAHPVKHQKAMR